MSGEIELVDDGDGLAVIGHPTDVERFFLSAGLDKEPSRELDLHKLWSAGTTAGAAVQVGANIAENSGRWVKLTAESAKNVRQFGLMATKTPGVSHAMIGKPGEVKHWLQIAQAPSALLSGPFALTALSTMMQQRAMQQQMDEIVEYLQDINEKVDDILRGQKDAVFADMIGVDFILEEAMTVREHAGRVSEVTWSKVQSTGGTIARTQAYAMRELDAIAEKLDKHADLGDIAKATREAEPRVREWLAVLARTVQLQDAASVLELDRVLDSEPEQLERHRIGLKAARDNRLQHIGGTTARLLERMDATVKRANAKVLFNPVDAPAAVRSSNRLAVDVNDFRGRLGIEAGGESSDAKRWRTAVAELGTKVVAAASDGVVIAKHAGEGAVEVGKGAFARVDYDGDGVPDKVRVAAAAGEAGAALKGAASGVADAVGTIFKRPRADRSADEGPGHATDA